MYQGIKDWIRKHIHFNVWLFDIRIGYEYNIYIYIFQLCPIHLYLQYYHSKYRGKIILLFNKKIYLNMKFLIA